MPTRQNVLELTEQMLIAAGWMVQDMNQFNPGASHGVAIRKFLTDIGPADYVLFVNRLPFGVIETVEGNEAATFTSSVEKAAGSACMNVWTQEGFALPFIYHYDGNNMQFIDRRDPQPRLRTVFTFHKPETLHDWGKQGSTLRRRLQSLSMLMTDGMNDAQIAAVKTLEQSFASAQPRTLIRMEPGPEKTFTAITTIYRLLKFAGAQRILFLSDTGKLEQEADKSFNDYRPPDDKRKFSDLFPVQRLTAQTFEPNVKVCIATIQAIYSVLKKESAVKGGGTPTQVDFSQFDKLKEVQYNPSVPMDAFDFIFIDDCHHTTYSLYRSVLEYFDSIIIGITSGRERRVEDFFKINMVKD
jgi:type I restriction enzyme, R subunit